MERAEALFLQRLDPAIVELAKRIGRGSEDVGCISGKFQTASRSDISGITVGNDENQLFDFIFKKMPDNPRYRQFTNSFTGADILVISDFEWSYLSDKNKKLIAETRMDGMKFYGLGIHTEKYELDKIDDSNDDDWINGYRFLKQCDYCYLYEKGKVVEYFERPKIFWN